MAAALAKSRENKLGDSSCPPSCVVCKSFQPVDGKFLKCLHIMCVKCLCDRVDRERSVLCTLCDSTTTGLVPGVDLHKQLVDCRPLLYAGNCGGRERNASKTCVTALCTVCEDDDVESSTRFRCSNCANRPLCPSHAEKHLQRKGFSGHNIVEIGTGDDDNAVNCPYHPFQACIAFCQACCTCMCKRCLELPVHTGHSMLNLRVAASQQREAVQEAVDVTKESSSGMEEAGKVKQVPEKPHSQFSHDFHRAVVHRSADWIKQQARATSKAIARFHKESHQLLQVEKARQLENLDQDIKGQLTALRRKKEVLESLIQNQVLTPTEGESPSRITEDCSARPSDLPLGLAQVSQLSARASCPITNMEAFSEVVAGMKVDVLVQIQRQPNIAKCVLDVPKILKVGTEASAVLELRDADNTAMDITADSPLADLLVEVVSPDGSVISPSLSRQGAAESGAKFSVQLDTKGTGVYVLNLGLCGFVMRAEEYTVSRAMKFDPRKCPLGVSLSAFDSIATKDMPGTSSRSVSGSGGVLTEKYAARRLEQHGAVKWAVTDQSLTGGRHTWQITIIDGLTFRGYTEEMFDVGVVSDSSYSIYWSRNGSVTCNSPKSGTGRRKMHRWHDRDVLEFALDCQASIFHCRNRRTGEESCIPDVDCSVALYPAVRMYVAGQKVEIL